MAALPFECVVAGTPVSHQSNNRELLRDWQSVIRAEAVTSWGVDPPSAERWLQITVIYLAAGRPVHMDNDNMAKPIQDALNRVAYRDDFQITDTIIRRVQRTAALRFDASPALLAAVTA